jgi:hypothetical protein
MGGNAAGGVKLFAYRHLVPKLRISFFQPNSLNGVNGDNFTATFGNCFLEDSSHFTVRRCMNTSQRSEEHGTFIFSGQATPKYLNLQHR